MRDPLSSYACLSSLSMRETSTNAEREFYTCVYEGQWLFCSKLWDIPPLRTNRRLTGTSTMYNLVMTDSSGMCSDAVILAWVNGADLHSELAAHWLETTLGQMWFLNCQILTILRWLADMRLVLFCYLARPPPTFRPQITSNQSISRAQAIHIGWRALQQMNIMGAT